MLWLILFLSLLLTMMLFVFPAGERLWKLRFKLFMIMRLRVLFHLVHGSMSLTANGFLRSSNTQMVLLSANKHVWLPKGLSSAMALIMRTPSVMLSSPPPSV
jgi:hypothetical protein